MSVPPRPTVLLVAGAFATVASVVVLVWFEGWSYYRAPLGMRGYLEQHQALRPSGSVGLTLGVAGTLAMLSTLPYLIRKRWKRLARVGTMNGWLDVHIFFGIVGPVLITFHTSFKFNGLISVGYWLMVIVWSSGFVGRYLFVRIPKGIRGAELTRDDVAAELDAVRARISAEPLPERVRVELEQFEAIASAPGRRPGAIDLFFGELRARFQLMLMRRELRRAGIDPTLVNSVVSLAALRAALTRRLTHLQRTRRLFELWHLFHQPLVYGLFAIVTVHVGVAMYMGYASVWATP